MRNVRIATLVVAPALALSAVAFAAPARAADGINSITASVKNSQTNQFSVTVSIGTPQVNYELIVDEGAAGVEVAEGTTSGTASGGQTTVTDPVNLNIGSVRDGEPIQPTADIIITTSNGFIEDDVATVTATCHLDSIGDGSCYKS